MSIKTLAIQTIVVIAIIMLFRSLFVSPLITKAVAAEVGQALRQHVGEEVEGSDPNAMSPQQVAMAAVMDTEHLRFWSNSMIDLIILVVLGAVFHRLSHVKVNAPDLTRGRE